MATYTIDGTKVGTILATAGTLTSIVMTQPPTTRSEQSFDPDGIPIAGYLALVDSSVTLRKTLLAVHQDNPL
jgi:hypothetical protein